MTAPTEAPGHVPGATPTRGFTITLPAGLALLNSNQRPHFKHKAAITRELRAAALFACTTNPAMRKALNAARGEPLLPRAHILGVLHPTDRGRRDPANWYPSFKAAVDGLVDARVLEDDDHTHVLGPDMRLGAVVKGAQLVLHLRELAPGEDWPTLTTLSEVSR